MTAMEAARQVLAQRKISKKINYAVLQGLFDTDGSAGPVDPSLLKRESAVAN